MSEERTNGNSSPLPCWPLPEAWRCAIPVAPVKIIEGEENGLKFTRPVWNDEWLRGLEQYVRSIVRDELSKANVALTKRSRRELARVGINNKRKD